MYKIPIGNIVVPDSLTESPSFLDPSGQIHYLLTPWSSAIDMNRRIFVSKNKFIPALMTSGELKWFDDTGVWGPDLPDLSNSGLFANDTFTHMGLSHDKDVLCGLTNAGRLWVHDLKDARITHIYDIALDCTVAAMAVNTDGTKVWIKAASNDIVELDITTGNTTTIAHSETLVDLIYNPTTDSLILACDSLDTLQIVDLSNQTITDITSDIVTMSGDYILHLTDMGNYILCGSTSNDPVVVLPTSLNTPIANIDPSIVGRVYPGPLNTFVTVGKTISKILSDTSVVAVMQGILHGLGSDAYLPTMSNVGDLKVEIPFTNAADDSIVRVITRDQARNDIVSYLYANEVDTVGGVLTIHLHSQDPVDVEVSGIPVPDHNKGYAYNIGDIVSPPDSSYKWRCTVAGTSSLETVRFDVDIDVNDGTVIWTKDNALVNTVFYTRLIPTF